MTDKFSQMDKKEFLFPETIYSRDIENKVFQGIVLQALSKIDGVGFIGGSLIDTLLGRDNSDRINGIFVEQDQKKHSLFVRVEINIRYGFSIPQKTEEIQNKIVEELTSFTALHVSCVHVIFKNLLVPKQETPAEKSATALEELSPTF